LVGAKRRAALGGFECGIAQIQLRTGAQAGGEIFAEKSALGGPNRLNAKFLQAARGFCAGRDGAQ